MSTESSMPNAGYSLTLVNAWGVHEFWSVNGNDAATATKPNIMYTTNSIHLFSGPRDVIGTLKTMNSKDPEILFATLSPVEMQANMLRIGSWIMTCVGGLVSLTIIGAVIGIPLILGGWYLRKKVKHQQEKINAAYQQFCQENGVLLRAA
ncbi:MAG: hypothetical protein IPP83_07685 [Flavobacteriales bacterium]|nr:hypothetical protein [Flavobacteriales bacterium]